MAIITTDKQYRVSQRKVTEMLQQENLTRKLQKEKGVSDKHIDLVLAPVVCFREGIEHEIREYEEIVKGNIPDYMKRIENIGLFLIPLRIKQGWTQTELAKQLGVPQSQISRDERNEYHGVSLPTIKKHLNLYDVKIKMEIE